MIGVEIAAKYAYPPNRKGYCGKSAFASVLRRYLAGGTDAVGIENGLKKFHTHHAYLSLIARENSMDPFDTQVVRAFWTGNSLLENVSHGALREFIARDLFQKSQKARAGRLSRNLPEGMLPHHSLNALYINFVTDRAARSLRNIDSCCVTWGRVLSIEGDSAVLRRSSIGWEDGFIIVPKTERIALSRAGVRFLGGVSRGDILSVHWGMAIERLRERDVCALERYTKKNIKALGDTGFTPIGFERKVIE